MTTTIKSNTTGFFPEGEVRVSGFRGTSGLQLVTHNTTCAKAANALAAAYAGETSLVPRKVAFVYGDSAADAPTLNRETTWESLAEFDKSIVGFSYRPTVDENKVIFHARTQGVPDNKLLYAACLLGASTVGNEYEVLAVVDLGSKEKPADFELSLDWTVKFNSGSVKDDTDGSDEPMES